ncbi:MAG TPA: UDP-N-acetylmuramate dehydrogenase [Candidatus Dormibacteraeota bacterium]|nr:UDP-N-acetylmuramate dehydrogenase [Candidatus Dormibacteraeota bacterium]
MSWRTPANLGWLARLPGLRQGQPLARLTSLNVGGPAEYFVATSAPGPLVQACRERAIPYLLLGAGTNLLIADQGVEGLVIRCVNRGWRVEGRRVYAEAGLKLMRLARICADHDLVGLEWAIGVPGTVGGAVYQNAGCWGGELADVLVEAEGVAPDGEPRSWSRAELALGYRTSALRAGPLRGALVTGAWIELRPGDGALARRRMAGWAELRARTQPIRTKNCGSVFVNPPGDSAGRLIEAAGLKGAREGDAEVSCQHANFIVNRGQATAADVDRLIRRVQAAVRERFGVVLEPEVERVGRWPSE